MAAILATAAGFSALAGKAQAQSSGSIGGDVGDNDPVKVLGDPNITLTDGNVAFQSGIGKTNSRGTVHVVGGENARKQHGIFQVPGSRQFVNRASRNRRAQCSDSREAALIGPARRSAGGRR
jgi:hypothetical protein